MSDKRRRIGSMLFKGMMAAGALYDLNKAVNTLNGALAGDPAAAAPELAAPAKPEGNAISFAGGAGISNIKHQRGTQMVSEGKSLIEEGNRLIRKGSAGTYDSTLISRGKALVSEGKALIQKGKALIQEAAKAVK